MRLVNADNPDLQAYTVYHKIKQPMPIYHSTEELHLNEPDPIIFIKEDLFEKYNDTRFSKEEQYFVPIKGNTFIATGEKYVPLTFTKEGYIMYETIGINVKPTDNCYIRLYGLYYRPGGTKELVTSTGMWTLSPNCNASAGVPPKLSHERSWNLKLNREVRQKSVVSITGKLKTSKKFTVMDYKFISRVLNPLSGDFFLNPMLSAKSSYRPNANPLSQKDLMEILSTERVQRLILKELKIVMPEIAKAIQDRSTPETIAELLHKVAEDTVNKEDATVDDKLLSLQAILNAGYPDDAVMLKRPVDIPMLQPGAVGLPVQNIIPYEPAKIMGGDEVDPVDKKPEPDKSMSDAQYKEAATDAGAVDDYTFEDMGLDNVSTPAN